MSIIFGKNVVRKYKRIAECHYIIENVNFVTNSFVVSGIDRICFSRWNNLQKCNG